MPTVVLLVLATATAGCVIIQLFAIVGWHRVVRESRSAAEDDRTSGPAPSVTVIVPARNEAGSIEACVESILANEYPSDRLSVCVVDDGSTDATAHRVRAMARRTRRSPIAAGDAPAEAPDAPPEGATEGTTEGATGDDASDEAAVYLVQVDADDTAPGRLPGDSTQGRSTQGRSTQGRTTPGRGTPGHKGLALKRGIDASRGEVILTTDADCTVGPRWVQTMVRRCTDETPFVSGPVRLQYTERWFERYQALEMTLLVALGAGGIGTGFPAICNGANLAIHRSLLASYDAGDGLAADELLLQHVAYDTAHDVAFEAHPDAIVDTRPVDTAREYLRQRARWASTARYPHALPFALASVMWLAHVAILLACLAAMVLPEWRQPALSALLVKMAGDGILASRAADHLGHEGLMRSFVPSSLLWVPSAVYAGLRGMLGSVEWKGRQVR
jgi:cellulose synthase/poly-beta-1,6-N-acetylglucosamine synthase-like glycosyltransferase